MKPRRVLVVDDDVDFAEATGETLRDAGYEVETVFSGEDAIRRFTSADFDVALMDIRMGGLNGIETLEAIRADKHDARIILMTGYPGGLLATGVIPRGASGMMDKPFDPDQLFDLIEKAVDLKNECP